MQSWQHDVNLKIILSKYVVKTVGSPYIPLYFISQFSSQKQWPAKVQCMVVLIIYSMWQNSSYGRLIYEISCIIFFLYLNKVKKMFSCQKSGCLWFTECLKSHFIGLKPVEERGLLRWPNKDVRIWLCKMTELYCKMTEKVRGL